MTPDPTRRSLLATVGATVGGALAGCIGVPTGPTGSGRWGETGEAIFSSPMGSRAEVSRFPIASQDDNIDVVSDPTGDNRDVVSIHVPEGDTRGGTLAYAPNETRDGSRSGENDPDSVFARYYVYFPSDTEMYDPDNSNHGTKLPGVAGFYTEAGDGGTEGDGHSWSARLQTDVVQESTDNSAFEMNYYVYHMDQERSDGYGDMLSWDGEYDFGQWHEVTLYTQLNTPGDNDGILRGWMNENQVFEREDFRFRSEDHPYAGITRAYAAYIYWGGSWGPPDSQNVYFKDFTLSHGNSSTGGDGGGPT